MWVNKQKAGTIIKRPGPWLMGCCLLLALAACVPDKDIEVKLPPYERKLAVEAYLTPGAPLSVLLSETNAYFDPLTNPGVADGQVVIGSGTRMDTLIFSPFLDLNTNKYLNYRSLEIFYPDTGLVYTLRAKDERGRSITGEARALPPAEIDTVEVRQTSNQHFALTIKIKDPPGSSNFYRVMVNRGNLKSQAEHDNLLTDQFSNGILSVPTGGVWKLGDTLYVRVYHLEEKHFRFLESIKDAQAASQNPFAQPAIIRSTVQGGFGVFAVLSGTQRKVTFP